MKNAASITIASGIIGLVALGIGYCAGTARQASKPVQAATSTVAFNPRPSKTSCAIICFRTRN